MSALSEWYAINLLNICWQNEIMLVGTRQRLSKLPKLDVQIRNETLDVSSYSYLGVVFDSELSFSLH